MFSSLFLCLLPYCLALQVQISIWFHLLSNQAPAPFISNISLFFPTESNNFLCFLHLRPTLLCLTNLPATKYLNNIFSFCSHPKKIVLLYPAEVELWYPSFLYNLWVISFFFILFCVCCVRALGRSPLENLFLRPLSSSSLSLCWSKTNELLLAFSNNYFQSFTKLNFHFYVHDLVYDNFLVYVTSWSVDVLGFMIKSRALNICKQYVFTFLKFSTQTSLASNFQSQF